MRRLMAISLMAGLIVLGGSLLEPWHPVSRVEAKEDWVLLGERTVKDNLDHDTIPVTMARGNFRRLKFAVRGHGIQMHHLIVHYGNGVSDKIETRFFIPAGGESRLIDLEGGDRVIKKIDFWYETKSLGKERAIVRVYGIR